MPSPRKQGKVGRGHPPKERQFGQPGGNPRHNGAWKKTETARWKFEQIIKMTDPELETIRDDASAAGFERSVANLVLKTRQVDDEKEMIAAWRVLESLTNQVYGTPKQTVETRDLTPPVPLSPRRQRKEKK